MTVSLPSAWTGPTFASVYIPNLPSLNLSEDEKATISRLNMVNWRQRENMLAHEAYYRGEQRLASLGIALPPELDGLRVIVGWPRMAVDPYVERLALDSFRKTDDLDSDELLRNIWLSSSMAGEESLAYTDALTLGRSWFLLNSADEDDGDANPEGYPEICVESPLNISASWDVRTKRPKALLQSYWHDGQRAAVLYLPEQTIYIDQNEDGEWSLSNRDEHGFGYIPAVRMANRPRSNFRDGISEISNELKSITDAAVRTLLNLTAASEFYSVPQKLILGATAEDFVSPDGTTKTAWETYIGRVLALQRDAEGALPEVKQFDAYDPSVFTKVVEMFAGQAAGIIGATPQELGLYTDGNPVSAEALQTAEARRDRRTRRIQANFSGSLVEVGQMAVRMMHGGALPREYANLAADWRDPEAVNFTGYADGLAKLMQEGAIARNSEVAWRKLGFDDIQRKRLAKELDADPVRKILTELGTSVEGKTLRLAMAAAAAAKPDGEGATPAPAAKSASGTPAKATPA